MSPCEVAATLGVDEPSDRRALFLLGARRVGAVHALGTDVATFLFMGSLVARLRGRYAAAARLGIWANLVMVGAGFLGGHLALNRGTARRDQ